MVSGYAMVRLGIGPGAGDLVRLIGFLGRDPEEYENRTILSLATEKSWKKPGSETWDSRTDWHRILVWDELVESVRSFAKGDHVEVDGQRHRRQQDADSRNRKCAHLAAISHR